MTEMLRKTQMDMERADKVNALLKRADWLCVRTTRRQARKALSGRGHLLQKLREAEANRQATS